MAIVVFTPFCETGEGVPVFRPYDKKPVGYCISAAYRKCMNLLGPNDWAVLCDHDIFHVTRGWFPMIEAAIAKDPKGTFVPMTNRLVRAKQGYMMTEPCDEWETNILKHFKRADELKEKHGGELQDITNIADTGAKEMTGIFIVISKDTWTAIGEIPLNTYACDWEIGKRVRAIGRKVWLMRGLYVVHLSGYRERLLGQPRYPDPPRMAPRAKPEAAR